MPDHPPADLPESPNSWPRFRFTIGRLMVVIAVAACLIGACVRAPILAELMAAMGPAFLITCLAFSSPWLLARPGRRLRLATRIAALWPLTIPASFHSAWAIARVSLGHPPGPADNGFWIGVLEASMAFFWLSSVISSAAALVLALVDAGSSVDDVAAVFFLLVIAWLAVVLILLWDPVQALVWFID